MASRTANMSRDWSFDASIAVRTGNANAPSHCVSKPAPPAPVVRVIHSLSPRSSAIISLPGKAASAELLHHCIRLQPSGSSGPSKPTSRMNLVASKRRPSIRNSSSHSIALSRM
jgi:hypothetical protein